MPINKIYFSYIYTYGYISAGTVTIISVSHKHTNNIQTVAQNVYLKQSDFKFISKRSLWVEFL
jgi:hypothetical protein